jgi:carboxyl-terminal processing protease
MERYGMSPEAQVYLAAALDLMQEYSINRDQVDWEGLRASAYQRAHGAQTTADTYAVIRWAVITHLDQHSSFQTPHVRSEIGDLQETQALVDIDGLVLEDRIGYIQVPSTFYYDMAVYSNAMQEKIREIDHSSICAWVVDLRGNIGGSFDPMLVGIGPILGEGIVFGSTYMDGGISWVHYREGKIAVEYEGHPELFVISDVLEKPAYELSRPDPYVAVLTDFYTASAAEAVTIALKPRPKTRSFGQPTAGVPTGNLGFRLSDGAVLNITAAYFMDRDGLVYDTIIRPDEMVWDLGLGGDPVLQAGVDWLLEQEGCKRG